MIPSKVDYHKPASVNEAVQLLADLGDDAKILAGGHSLIPMMKLRLANPEQLVDISGIEDLQVIRDNEKSITIGACASHSDIANNEAVQKHAPMLAKAGAAIGDVQIRNFGTLGGSIAHADPAADWPGVLLAANASVVIAGPGGKREVDIDQFFKGLFTTAIEDGEIITAVKIPKTAANANSTYVKFAQPASRFAMAACAAALEMDGSTVKSARVAFNGVSATPFRDTGIENALSGQSLSPDSISSATSGAADGVSIMSDQYASEDYRKHLAGVVAQRALSELA